MFTIKKNIRGKEVIYLEKSLRLPDGSMRKINKKISSEKYKPTEDDKIYFLEKEKQIMYGFALKNYKHNYPLTDEEVRKIEGMKVEYRYLLRKIPKNRLKDLLDRFTVNFTYESNAIEGNSLTIKDVAIVLFDKLNVKGKTLREIYETRNSRPVVEMMLKSKIKIKREEIIKIHKMLMKDIDEEIGYRTLPMRILGAEHLKPPLPEKVKGEMDKLFEWYEKNKNELHPLELATNFHAKFEEIHPFSDGNGRVGRILLNSILIENKYPPIIIRKTTRVAYLKCLKAYDTTSSIPLMRFVIEKYKKTFRGFFEVYVRYV